MRISIRMVISVLIKRNQSSNNYWNRINTTEGESKIKNCAQLFETSSSIPQELIL